MSDFGAFVRKERKARKVTLDVLSAELRCSKTYLSKVERGQKGCSWRFARAVADALGMEEVEFVARLALERGAIPLPPGTTLEEVRFAMETVKGFERHHDRRKGEGL